MLLPFLLAIVALVIAPILWDLRISFTDSRIIGLAYDKVFTLENYDTVFSDPETWHSVFVTIQVSLGTVVGSITLIPITRPDPDPVFLQQTNSSNVSLFTGRYRPEVAPSIRDML